MSSSTGTIPNQFPRFSGEQLGECSAWKRICKCCRREDDDPDDNGPRRWRTVDAIALDSMGAFLDPVGFLYSDKVKEETREKILKIITNNELRLPKSKAKEESFDEEQGNNKSPEADEEPKEALQTDSNSNDIDETTKKEENVCTICLQELEEESYEIKACGHCFHSTCIKAWISRSLSCPVCRKDIVSKDRLKDYLAANRKFLLVEDP